MPSAPLACEHTWAQAARPALDTWCAPCHGTAISGPTRQGAPVGMDFDSYAGAAPWASEIGRAVAGPTPRMPPTGGPSDEQRAALVRWAECGGPGTASPEPPCSAPSSVVGDLSDPACHGHDLAVEGSVVLSADTVLPCLCSVSGDLHIEGAATAVQLPELRTVGGGIEVSAELIELSLPMLSEVQRLSVVGGRLPAVWNLASLQTSDLLTIEGADGLQTLALPRLEAVRGALVLGALPKLSALTPLADLDAVHGDLHVVAMDALVELRDFRHVTRVGGDLVIEGNQALERIEAFHWLEVVEGSLRIERNDALTTLAGFGRLRRIEGDLVIRGHPGLGPDQVRALLDQLGSKGIGGTIWLDDVE